MGNKVHNIFMLQNEVQNNLLSIQKDFGLSYHELLLVLQGVENNIRQMSMTHTFYEEYRHLQAMQKAQSKTGEVPSVNTSDFE